MRMSTYDRVCPKMCTYACAHVPTHHHFAVCRGAEGKEVLGDILVFSHRDLQRCTGEECEQMHA